MTVAARPQGRQKRERPSSTETRQATQALGRAIGYIKRYKKEAAYAYLALIIATAAQLAVPQLVQSIIDTITESANLSVADLSLGQRAIITAMITIVIFSVARGFFSFIQTYMSEVLSQNIAFEIRNDIFTKIQRLSFSYHDKNQTGQLMVRATDDVERLRQFIGQGLILAFQAIILLVGTLIILFLTNWQLTLVVLPVLPIAMLSFGIFGSKVQPMFGEVQRRLSVVNTILQENMAGLKVVKAFASEAREKARFEQHINHLLDQHMVINRTLSILFPVTFTVASIGQAALLYFAGRQIINETLTLGEWQEFSLYLVYLFLPMAQLGFIIALQAQAAASAKRIFEILDAKNEVEDKAGAATLERVNGRTAFNDVTFRYFKSGDAVLQNLNFVAEPGQTVAILGSTGSGKTTFINLIPRFYDVSEGSLTIDDHDIREVTLDSLRQQIGIVLQETTLFSGSIRDNIAFGRPDATDAEITAVSKAAAAHDFIMSFPDGYDTPVGERGSTLSGGQKQRVAIARALLMNPQILIMDDSTSSVDFQTERQIQNALDQLMEGRTSFVIAQRISTVRNADQIIVLDKGRIAALGTHEELMEESAIYADIYHSQLVD